jgi:Protein of unknown function (DUF1236)
MRKARLLSTVAATLLFAVGAASAQTMKKDEAPAPAPAAQQNAPAEKIAPAMKPGEQKADTKKAPATVGQAPKASEPGKSQTMDKSAPAGAAADVKADSKADVRSEATPKAKDNVKASENAGAKEAAPAAAKPAGEQNRATTGQGAAAGSAKLTAEQHTKITAIIKQQKVAPAQLSVSISVGTRVPDSVHFYPLPQEVFVIYPEWRGYDYILVGNQILVIDHRTHQIVAILEA